MSGRGRRKGSAAGADRQPVIVTDVLDRASDLFYRMGFNGTRMQDIANEFGVTHAALYYHFESKNDILGQVNVREVTALRDNALVIVSEGDDPVEQLLRLVEHHLRYVASNPANAATLFDNDLEMPEHSLQEVQALRREYTQVLADLYERGAAAGRLVEVKPMVAVSLLLGACNWVYRWFHPERHDIDELVEQGMLMIRGLIVSREPIP